MSAWPETVKVGPIGDWPGEPTRPRRVSNFSATLTDTLRILRRDIYYLVDTKAQQDSAEVLVAIPAGAFRLDGRPYANAKAEHPGIIFSIDSRHGHLSYPCDTFTTWEDNLRAVALALEALRKVDRYGVTGVTILRRAQRSSHPDHGGDTATFQRVTLAEAKLRQEGLL